MSIEVLVYIGTICYITTTSQSPTPGCSQPLGMEDGRIAASQISASSSYQHSLVGANKGRLNSEAGGGAWCPKGMISSQDENQEYLQIDLLVDHIITSVVIQGRFGNGLGQEYTEYFILQFWREGMEGFVEYGEDGKAAILTANTNTYQAVEQVINKTSVIASKVRIVPYSAHPRTVCLRVEVKGCRYVGSPEAVNTTENKDVGDWEEPLFLGAAVGILVTMLVAAVAAIVLVLVRNTRQKRNLSELAHYNNLNTSTTTSSIHSSLTSKHCHEGVVMNQDEDILKFVMFKRSTHLELEKQPDNNHLDKPPLTTLINSSRSSSVPQSSSTPNSYVQFKMGSWLPVTPDMTKQSFNDTNIRRNTETVKITG